jgi:uncharacterized protein (DUF885 family)
MYQEMVALAVCLLLTLPVRAAEKLITDPSSQALNSANQVIDRYFDTYFQFHPSAGTADGFHQYDSQLEDFSQANLERERGALKTLLPELQAMLERKVPQATADDLEFLESQASSRLLELETIRMWEKDPDVYGSGPAYSIFLVMKRNFAPPDNRLRSVIARERQIPAMFEAARHNLRNPPHVYTEVALEQLPGTIEFFRTDVPAAFTAVKDPPLLAEFEATNHEVIEAYKKFETFLRKDLLPVSNGDFRLGVETFRKKLLYDEMVDIPLARLLEIGYADLRHNQEWLKRVTAQVDPKKSPREVVAALQADHPAPDQLLQSFRDVLGSLRGFIAQKKIITIPSQVEPVVEETPPFARALTTAAMDTPGPYETKSKEGIFEVTLPDSQWKPDQVAQYMNGFSRGTIVSTAVHEVYPGHYVQYLWSLTAPSKVRKLIYCDSNSEGWAHYTEQMMLDEGYSSDPRLRVGQLVDALLRDARFIVGVQMHTGNMTVEQAKDFFIQEGYQVPPIAEVEARRGTSDPTYLVYTLGKLQITKLREDYKQLRGDKFSLLEFHDRFMDQGAIPLKLIRRAMLGNDSPTL